MYELQVEGMSCDHCVSKVTKSVIEVDANAKVEVDIKSQKVRVDSTAELGDIAAALANAGYAVSSSTVS